MFRKRLLAFIIDIVVFYIFAFVSAGLIYLGDVYNNKELLIISALLFIFNYLCFIFKDVKNGQSVGKKILKLRIVCENNTNTPIWKLLIRSLFLVIWPAEFLALLIKEKRIADMILKTIIIEQV